MVDALSRAGRWLEPPLGRIIDLRPAHPRADVELHAPDGSRRRVGSLTVDDERRLRHLSADLAVLAVLKRGRLRVEAEAEFPFYRYPDSVDELREYIATRWQHTRLDEATSARTKAMQREYPDARLALREVVGIRTLQPL